MKKYRSKRIRYCTPNENQYMLLQLVYWVRIPERRRATSIPRRRPDTTMERAVARRWIGARSPTSGSISWGVTVVTPVMNERARKTGKDFVTQRPTHCKFISHNTTNESSGRVNSLPLLWKTPMQAQNVFSERYLPEGIGRAAQQHTQLALVSVHERTAHC